MGEVKQLEPLKTNAGNNNTFSTYCLKYVISRNAYCLHVGLSCLHVTKVWKPMASRKQLIFYELTTSTHMQQRQASIITCHIVVFIYKVVEALVLLRLACWKYRIDNYVSHHDYLDTHTVSGNVPGRGVGEGKKWTKSPGTPNF